MHNKPAAEKSRKYHALIKNLDAIERALCIINNTCNRETAKIEAKGRKVKFHIVVEYLDGVSETSEIPGVLPVQKVNDEVIETALAQEQVRVEEKKVFISPTSEDIQELNRVPGEKMVLLEPSKRTRESTTVSMFISLCQEDL